MRTLGTGLAAGALLSLASFGTALAGPTTVTVNPAGANPALSGATFTADTWTVNDFAAASIAANGDFAEHGVLVASSFSLNGSPVTAPGYNASPGYSLYFVFDATGNQGGPVPGVGGTTTGHVDSLSYQLFANPNGPTSVNIDGSGNIAISGNAGAFVLGNGTLTGGAASTTVALSHNASGFTANADVLSILTECTGAGSGPGCLADETPFFQLPTTISLKLDSNFSSNTQQTGVNGSTLIIGRNPISGNSSPGGGSITFSTVPEPATLTLLGFGLVSLGFMKRRRRA